MSRSPHPLPRPRHLPRTRSALTGAAAGSAAALLAALVAPGAAAAPAPGGVLGMLTDQTSLAGTPLAPGATADAGSVYDALRGGADSLGASGSDAKPDLARSIGGDLGCVLGSTGITGAASLGTGGGAGNAVPWLNGRTGALPDLTGPAQAVSRLTGPTSTQHTAERFNIVGTDLGIMWDDGTGKTLMAFGDTVGASADPACEGIVGDWRSNILLRSDDTDLSDGLEITGAAMSGPHRAKEIIPSLKQPGIEQTVIPTAGIAVPHDGSAGGFRQYIDFMSVRSWGAPGEWTTNYSALAYSDDGGESWTAPTFGSVTANPGQGGAGLDSLRPNAGGNANFQMGAFVRDHTENEDDPDSYVYMFGTPSGRNGAAYLARVHQKDIAATADYQYWDGDDWADGPADAAPVIGGPVSELSVAYNEFLGRYIAMYTTADSGLVVRTADTLTGPWSPPTTIIASGAVPTLYGGFMHPASNASGSSELYFLATTWSDYNVMLMRTDLSALAH